MEPITLAAFLEKNPKSKRLQKRFAKAVKTFVRMTESSELASSDLDEAKAHSATAIQEAEQAVTDCRDLLAKWSIPEEPSLQDGCGEEAENSDGVFLPAIPVEALVEDDSQIDVFEEALNHLVETSQKIQCSLIEAENILSKLRKIDGLLFDILEIAEEENCVINVAEAKQYIVQKAQEEIKSPSL